MSPQVRDVIEAALSEYTELLEGRADIQDSCGQPVLAANTMRQWARATAALRSIRNERD